jgi:hypothetical protein
LEVSKKQGKFLLGKAPFFEEGVIDAGADEVFKARVKEFDKLGAAPF